MAQLISDNEIFFTAFEPKVQNRFVMYVGGVPAFMIKKTNRPQFETGDVVLDHINVERKLKGKHRWGDMNITMYDPIVPSGAQTIMEWVRLAHESTTGRDGYANFYKKDITFVVLGPPGDIVEEWKIVGAYVANAQFGEMDWSVDTQIEITATLKYDYAILSF